MGWQMNLKANCIINKTDLLTKFYNDIRNIPLLSKEEELLLLQNVHNTDKIISQKAINKLVESNQRFVISVARKFCSNHNSVLDLINEGNIGLMQAIFNYKIEFGVSFITFAVHYIRKYITEFVTFQNVSIKDSNLKRINFLIKKINNIFYQKNERYPSNYELMEELKENYGLKIKNENSLSNTHISYIDDTFMDNEGKELPVVDKWGYNEYTSSYNDYVTIENQEYIKEYINMILSHLSERDKKIISMTYGIGYDRQFDTNEIAKVLGYTSQRIWQLQKEIINKIKKQIKAS